MDPKALTHDEKKAAEAAFEGRPFNPNWSAAARQVYDGILQHLEAQALAPSDNATETQSLRAEGEISSNPGEGGDIGSEAVPRYQGAGDIHELLKHRSPHDTLETDRLVDVTSVARHVGIPIPVGISKLLWDHGITVADAVPRDQHDQRVRDVLLALRLRLANGPVNSAMIHFPAPLSFPPEEVPRLCSLFAVVHGHSRGATAVAVVLPHEIFSNVPAADQ